MLRRFHPAPPWPSKDRTAATDVSVPRPRRAAQRTGATGGGRRARRPLGHDEAGSLMVVEALLAGMIILTAVMFLTNVAKPSPPAAESGIDLEGVARDILVVLENRPPTAHNCGTALPATQCFTSRLGQMVGQSVGEGDSTYGVDDENERDAANAAAESFLEQVIPVGNRWLLRLDNGMEPLVLLPTSGSQVQLTPRAAKAAETFIVPQWQANALACGTPPAVATLQPGGPEGALDVDAGHSLYSPSGELPPQGHTSWAAWWVAQQDRFDPTGSRDNIPANALYGWWWLDGNDDGAVDGGECHFVGLPDGTATDFPVYGVQLVVWPIAG